ncbi:MAG: hypothetical protein JJT93_14175 [Gammaproteobacteria bacterium]|nr:hypothetical protein [Gammaproteobacteria bacterium]
MLKAAAFFLVATLITGSLLSLQSLVIHGTQQLDATDLELIILGLFFMAAFAALVGAIVWLGLVRLIARFGWRRPLTDGLLGGLVGLVLTFLFGPDMADILSRLAFVLGFSAAALAWWILQRSPQARP